MTDENGRNCKGTKADGSPCGAPSRLVDPDTGFCDAHDPDKRDEMRDRGRRGGYRSTSPRRSHGMDLPPLEDLASARTWSEEIARALAEDRISAKTANGMTRLLKLWSTNYAEEEAEALDRKAREGDVFGPRAEDVADTG